MIQIKPKTDGSRTLRIDTPYLILDAVVRPDGTLAATRCEIPPDPRLPTDEQIATATTRAETCEACEHGSNVRLKILTGVGEKDIYKVTCAECKKCGSGVSLLNGRCPANLWA